MRCHRLGSTGRDRGLAPAGGGVGSGGGGGGGGWGRVGGRGGGGGGGVPGEGGGGGLGRGVGPGWIGSLVTPFGPEGNLAHWQGGEMVFQALSGMMHNNGEYGR